MSEYELLHRLIDIMQYKANYQRKLSGLGKRFEFILERICMNENISPKELSQKYNLPPSTLTGQLDKLEREGLIERIYSKTDRRSIALTATANGKNIIKIHEKSDERFSENFFGSLNGDDRKKFKILLSKLIENIDIDMLFSEEV